MNPELTSFAARLRGLIASSASASCPPARSLKLISESQFSELAQELFALQFTHNPAYRRICEARGATPGTLEDWSQIPAVPAAAFKELDLTCLAPDERVTVFNSSGTTGQQRSRHFHNRESLELYEASLWPWFEQHVLAGLQAGSWHLLSLTPEQQAAPNSSLVCMFESVSQRSRPRTVTFAGETLADGGWSLALDRVLPVLNRAVEKAEPVVILGTAFNFVHLMDGMAEHGQTFQLPPDSRIMETGGYKGRARELAKPELHALVSDKLGVPQSYIVCEYGMSELSSQAYDGIAGATRNPKLETRNFAFPPWCRAQIISPETGQEVADGETGLVRVYDLANAFSVLAIQTEDMAIRREHGFELIGRAVAAEPRGCSLMQV